MKKRPLCSQSGFTLVELLVTIPVGLFLMAGLYQAFKIQQDSYLVQDQTTAMQQNLRGAMHLITRDLLMAGYLSSLDTSPHTLDWDGSKGAGSEARRPLIIGRDNVHVAGDDVKSNTDTLVIVKASDEGRSLNAGESATGDKIALTSVVGYLNAPPGKKNFGIMVKQDYTKADFFEVKSIAGNIITLKSALSVTYGPEDLLYRADLIAYRIDEEDPPNLRRANKGEGIGYGIIAENIENMQFRYQLGNGTWTDDPSGMEPSIRAVQVFLMGRTAKPQRGYRDDETYAIANSPAIHPNDGYRRKIFSTTVKTRNIGL